jgi:hypothetical protein
MIRNLGWTGTCSPDPANPFKNATLMETEAGAVGHYCNVPFADLNWPGTVAVPPTSDLAQPAPVMPQAGQGLALDPATVHNTLYVAPQQPSLSPGPALVTVPAAPTPGLPWYAWAGGAGLLLFLLSKK